MRGAPDRINVGLLQIGIIPADAGSTDPKDVILTLNGDHPRGCGEHAKARQDYSPLKGSSPRMRGAHVRRRHKMGWPRIIPADAGSTGPCGRRKLMVPDHPRGCGEHVLAPDVTDSVSGSSPRMRGAPSTVWPGPPI